MTETNDGTNNSKDQKIGRINTKHRVYVKVLLLRLRLLHTCNKMCGSIKIMPDSLGAPIEDRGTAE